MNENLLTYNLQLNLFPPYDSPQFLLDLYAKVKRICSRKKHVSTSNTSCYINEYNFFFFYQ